MRLSVAADDVRRALAERADPGAAIAAARFFRTGPGEYAEGDVFIGVAMPAIRRLLPRFDTCTLDDIDSLLDDGVHEHRMCALLLLVRRFDSAPGSGSTPDEVVDRYLRAVARGRVDNWDLVDASAEFILGAYLLDRPRDVLDELAASPSLWSRRVAIVATFGLIRRGDASTTLSLAERLLDDPEPLIRKATGWMLREVGKRVDRSLLIAFLDAHAARMSRITLSYATEHLAPDIRAAYRARR